jgi:ABC-type transport system involved in cytochrome c biogenesis permease subunit
MLIGILGFYAASQVVRSLSPTMEKNGMRLDLLGRIPVTYEGRVQPLDSLARNTARKLSNREIVTHTKGAYELSEDRSAMEWMADTIFESEDADHYEIIRVEDINVQNALGLPRRKGLTYTFAEIRNSDEKLLELLKEAEKQDPEQWTSFQHRLKEVYEKSRTVLAMQILLRLSTDHCEPGNTLERLKNGALIADVKLNLPMIATTGDPNRGWMSLATAVDRLWLNEKAKEFNETNIDRLGRQILRQEMIKTEIIRQLMSSEELLKVLQDHLKLTDKSQIAARLSANWEQFPKELYREAVATIEPMVDELLNRQPIDKDDPISAMIRAINGADQDQVANVPTRDFELLTGLKQAYLSKDAVTFNQLLVDYHASVSSNPPLDFRQAAHSTEIVHNHLQPFYLSTVLYLIAFLVSICAWIGLRLPLNRAAFGIICLGVALHVAGLVMRIVISGRPPVTNLYSSFVFVSAIGVIVLLVVEFITRRGIGNVLASLAGFMALMYAWTLSIDQGDTFKVLVAVLDTQFWLSTHVISISLGYVATLAAGGLGLALLLGSLLTRRFTDNDRRGLARIIYGISCFALLFSFFGTVLGGLWADDSWGRFWGWDPKENGALMIVLWNALILHARWAGIVRERGLAALAVMGNVVTIWSWEGINQFGVGMHAYSGLSSGESMTRFYLEPLFYIQAFVVVNLVVCAIGFLVPTSRWASVRAAQDARIP